MLRLTPHALHCCSRSQAREHAVSIFVAYATFDTQCTALFFTITDRTLFETWCTALLLTVTDRTHKIAGFTHSAFVFGYESFAHKSPINVNEVPPGALISFVQKGLQYLELEANLNNVRPAHVACTPIWSVALSSK